MHGNWNGYLVKALTQLAAVYRVCKSPRLKEATARAVTGPAHRKLPSAKRRKVNASAFTVVLILVLAAIILKKIT